MSALTSGLKGSDLQVIAAVPSFDEAQIELVVESVLRILPERREVYAAAMSVSGATADVVVKRFLNHPKQTRDWQAEWNGLLGLQSKGLPGALPICVAQSTADGSVWVVMQRIQNAVTLGAFLEVSNAQAFESVVQDLCALVDQVHASGVRQRDQHIDNWAVADGALYLLDAGTIELAEKALNEGDRLKDLAAICVTLTPAAEQVFRKTLLSNYLQKDQVLRERVLGQLDPQIVELQCKRARRYYKKTMRNCTEFSEVKCAGYQGMRLNAGPSNLVDAFFTDPEAFFKKGTCLKDGNTCTVQGFEDKGTHYVIKRYNKKPLFDRLRRACSPTRARTSWSSARLLHLAFVPTARTLAYYEERSGFLRGRCYLLMEQLDGLLLPDYIEKHESSAAHLSAVAESFATVWNALDRLRAAHGDLKATNLLVDSAGVVYLFDLDAFRFGLGQQAFENGRQKDYKRFMKNWHDQPAVQRAFVAAIEKGGSE